MRAIYLESKKVLKEKIVIVDKPKDNEVLIKVKSVGICGSDLHYWEHGRIGNFIVERPIILGHEVTGEVVDLGDNVRNLNIGDLVALEPGVPCGTCEYCTSGRYNLCQKIVFFATPPDDGALREYITHDSSFAFKIPSGLDTETATLVEPLAVGVYAVKRAHIQSGQRVLIYGSGVIGLCTMIAAFEAGAVEVAMVDILENKLNFAQKLGASLVYNDINKIPEKSFDIAFECTGAEATLINAAKVVKPGGSVVLIGLGSSSVQRAPICDFIINEQNLISVFRYAGVFPEALQVLAANKEKFRNMITHRYKSIETEAAFETARHNTDSVKVIINF